MGLLWDLLHEVEDGYPLGEQERIMDHLIITISRQYGSGGSLIGTLVAEKLGIPCYDRNSIDRIAHERGLDTTYTPHWQEQVSALTIWGAEDQMVEKQRWPARKKHPSYYSDERNMFLIQSRLIYELAEQGPCVFVGRCAGYVLKHWPRCLRVWINADEDSRMVRLYDEYLVQTTSLSQTLRLVDQGRAAYYKRCTGQAWGDSQSYYIQLNSGVLGIGVCADSILCAVQNI